MKLITLHAQEDEDDHDEVTVQTPPGASIPAILTVIENFRYNDMDDHKALDVLLKQLLALGCKQILPDYEFMMYDHKADRINQNV